MQGFANTSLEKHVINRDVQTGRSVSASEQHD